MNLNIKKNLCILNSIFLYVKTHVWFHLGRVSCKWFHKWKLIGNILNFTIDFTWDLSLARDRPYEYKEQVKTRGTWKSFHLNFHLWKSGHPIQVSIWSVTCCSLVQEGMSYGIHKLVHKRYFFLELKGCSWLCLELKGRERKSTSSRRRRSFYTLAGRSREALCFRGFRFLEN